jgi:UDP-N-acetylmuramyl tripeptide synthase
VVSRLADRAVVTSDNPRSEDPLKIIQAIRGGISGNCEIEADRAKAIAAAIDGADDADVVLIAGKGHENYQEIAGKRLPFSDAAVARDASAAGRARMMSLSRGGRRASARAGTEPTCASARCRATRARCAAGDLFVALRGERFDGHAFLRKRRVLGAAAALIDRKHLDERRCRRWWWTITRLALGALARHWRGRFHPALVAVAGLER